MDKKQQQASLLSDSLSEPEVPDLELVPPIKAKKRLRRMKLPSSNKNDPNAVSFSLANTLHKTKSACTFVTIAVIIVCLVLSNAYLAYLITETRSQMQLLSDNMAKLHAESLQACDAKISAAQKKVIETGALKVYEQINASLSTGQQIDSVIQAQIYQITSNVSKLDNELNTILIEHEAKVTALANNMTELRDFCLSGCGALGTAVPISKPAPKEGRP